MEESISKIKTSLVIKNGRRGGFKYYFIFNFVYLKINLLFLIFIIIKSLSQLRWIRVHGFYILLIHKLSDMGFHGSGRVRLKPRPEFRNTSPFLPKPDTVVGAWTQLDPPQHVVLEAAHLVNQAGLYLTTSTGSWTNLIQARGFTKLQALSFEPLCLRQIRQGFRLCMTSFKCDPNIKRVQLLDPDTLGLLWLDAFDWVKVWKSKHQSTNWSMGCQVAHRIN